MPGDIPPSELSFQFVRSGGPGGQNVNKRSTQVILRWRPSESPSLRDDVRARLIQQQRHRITKDGTLVIRSQRYRDQGRNVADCLEKLRQMLADAARPPKPRRPTRPTRASREARLAAKRQRGRLKRERRTPDQE